MSRKSIPALLATASLLVAAPCLAKPAAHHTSHAALHHAAHTTTSRSHKSAAASHKIAAPAAMSTERATEIQTALIKAGYLQGQPTGVWDAQSTAAMQKMQGDNGWQTKITPDSRALIKLGLGPQSTQAASTQTTEDRTGS